MAFDEHQYLDDGILAKAIASGKVKTRLSIVDFYDEYDKPLQEVVVSKKDPRCALALCKSYTDDPIFELKTRKMGPNVCIQRVERMLPCAITGIIVRGMLMLQAITQWVLNPTVFRSCQHLKFILPTTLVFPIHFANAVGDNHTINRYTAAFVPKLFTTTMHGKYVAICEMLKRLPVEVVELVSNQMGGPINLSEGVSPHSFKYDVTGASQYTTIGGDVSSIFGNASQIFCSVASLLELVEKGVMDIAITDYENGNYMTLSPDAFHHVFADGRPSHLVGMFNTEDEMMTHRQKILDRLHKYVRKLS
jgi:hypothetical protein